LANTRLFNLNYFIFTPRTFNEKIPNKNLKMIKSFIHFKSFNLNIIRNEKLNEFFDIFCETNLMNSKIDKKKKFDSLSKKLADLDDFQNIEISRKLNSVCFFFEDASTYLHKERKNQVLCFF